MGKTAKKWVVALPMIAVGAALVCGSVYFGRQAFNEHSNYVEAEKTNTEVQDIVQGEEEYPQISVDSGSNDRAYPHVDESLLPPHVIIDDAAENSYTINRPDDIPDPDSPDLDWYMSMQIKVDNLHAINPDVVSWIYIPDTRINYPIVQEQWDAAQNQTGEYYIHNDIYGEFSVDGSLFVKAIAPGLDAAKNAHTTVYGHNMKDGSMFATLVEYKDAAFFQKNPYIYMFYPDRTERWAVWSVGHVTDTAPVYTTYFEKGTAEYRNCIDFINANRYYDTWVSGVDETAETLTLSTCDWIGESHEGRMILTAVRDKTLIWK